MKRLLLLMCMVTGYSLFAQNVPLAPTLGNATQAGMQIAVTAGDGNLATTEYAFQESNSGYYLQINGSLNVAPAWKTSAMWSTTAVNGLSNSTSYTFAAKAKDGTSESAFGGGASLATLAKKPGAPAASNATTNSIDVSINANGNVATTLFAIRERSTITYVQADGSLGSSAVWQTAAAWATITVTGLMPSKTYSFDAKAKNPNGVETAFSSTTNYATLCAAPSISGQPSTTQTVCLSSSPSCISVAATGTNITYQWYENATNSNSGGTAITGATSSYFTPPAGVAAGSMYYYCVVSSGSCTAASDVSEVMVLAAPGSSTTDLTLCASSLPYEWNGLTFTASGSQTAHIATASACDSTATLNLTVANETTSYTAVGLCATSYTWNGVTYTATGDYTFTSVNAAGCDSVATLHLVLAGPAMSSSFTTASTTCNGGSDGTATVTMAGGVPPYSFKLGPNGTPQSSNVFIGLKASNYRVYVTDSVGCSYFTNIINVAQPAAIGYTFSTTPATCYNTPTGSITVNASGGTSPYQYKLGSTGTYQSSGTFSVKGSVYRVYIKDSKGCEKFTEVITVSQPTQLTVSFTKTNASCPTSSNGTITASASGGTASYMYQNSPTGTLQSSGAFTGIKQGNYRIYVHDAAGCVSFSDIINIGANSSVCKMESSSSTSRMEAPKASATLTLAPNPSASNFTLTLPSGGTQAIQLRVLTQNGNTIFQAKGMPGEVLKFGESWANGIYMLEVKQGDEVKVLKAVKMR